MLCGSFLCSLCLCVLLAFSAAEAIPLSQDRTGLMSPDHSTFLARNEPRGAYQSSSNPTPRALSEPIMLYYFTCGPTVTLFAQGHSLKDVYRPVLGKRKLLMFPDQGIGSFAPRRCKDNNFAVVEFELDTSKGLIVQDKRSMRSSSSSLFSLGRGKSDVILSPTMKSNAMATLGH
ncbi:uncharacterized protein C8R40DRAFT_642166 [Lentinula edodes]|uniref:uncharacterized protein n=1 Tax=Lentinula edodes TaxID=5353 RepID=UPI001E8D1F96|nr:uncharacterized protein C8R40DRAFT_642166 [Lentinula edodes]KAH7870522.1 hypothetical protein C8R40DRAFT_642166 [Lentinula edodes]